MKKGTNKKENKTKKQENFDSKKEKTISNNSKNSNNIKEKGIINTIIPLENVKGSNICYINVIIQILYHSPFVQEELNKIEFENNENDKLNPLYELKKLFTEYKNLAVEKNEKSIINVQNFRYTLSELFPDVIIANQSGDPIEILNYLFNIMHLFTIKGKKLNDQNSSSYNCKNECISHRLFALKIKENLICSKCKKKNTINYDNNYFIYEIFTFEILNYCDKFESKDFRNKIFDYSKTINSKIDYNMEIKDCKCQSRKINKELIQYEQFSSNLIINLTWDSPIPLLTDICKMYTLIPQITSNSNLFKVDKKLTKDYYLYGLILYYNNHYTNAIYIYNENSWYFCDDIKYRKFNSYKELIDYLILNHIHPVILFYSIKSYNKEIDKDEVYHTNEYNIQYNKCIEIDKKNGFNPAFNFNICDSNLTKSVIINEKLNALENYKRTLNSSSKLGILCSINNINSSKLWFCPNCKKKNNITNNKCRICNREFEIDNKIIDNKTIDHITIESEQLPETIYDKGFTQLRANKKKNNNKNQINTLKDNIVGDKNMKFLIQSQREFKNDGKRVDVGNKYIGCSIINEENDGLDSINLKKDFRK